MLKLTTTNTNIIRTRLIVYTEDVDEAEDEALACTKAKEIVEGVHTVRNDDDDDYYFRLVGPPKGYKDVLS